MKTAILGASDKPERFAYKAMKRLESAGHETYLVNPNLEEVEGAKVFPALGDVPEKVDTLAMYVGAGISSKLENDILKLSPRRVIFNPGAENRELASRLDRQGIKAVEGCVLVMLNTGQF